ncbi:MAG: alkaline phosphatase family protein [Armatimonadota bacterium]
MSGPIVMMMLDSLADAYVQRGDAPYFQSRIPDGNYVSLKSLFAFEGIMAAVITGKWPDDTGVFARFAYGPSESVQRLNPLRALNLVDKHAYYADGERRDSRQNFPAVKAVRKLLKKYWITGGFNNLTPYGRLPLALAHHFRYSMILGAYDQTLQLAGYQTLFGLADQLKKPKFYFYGKLGDAKCRLEQAGNLNDYGIIFIHTWSHLDTEGHNFGPEADEIRQMTRDCDTELSQFLPWLETRAEDASCVLFADHGMHPVHSTIDVGDLVTQAINGEGALVFVDSTAVRAWGTEAQIERVRTRMTGVDGVQILAQSDLEARRAYFPSHEYGELFAVAAPGHVFAPDYFVGWDLRKGMHGYFQDSDWLRPALLWYGPAFHGNSITPKNMTDIHTLAESAMILKTGETQRA